MSASSSSKQERSEDGRSEISPFSAAHAQHTNNRCNSQLAEPSGCVVRGRSETSPRLCGSGFSGRGPPENQSASLLVRVTYCVVLDDTHDDDGDDDDQLRSSWSWCVTEKVRIVHLTLHRRCVTEKARIMYFTQHCPHGVGMHRCIADAKVSTNIHDSSGVHTLFIKSESNCTEIIGLSQNFFVLF